MKMEKELKIYTLKDDLGMYKYLGVETNKDVFLNSYGFENIILEPIQGCDGLYYRFIDDGGAKWIFYEEEIKEGYRFEAEYSYGKIG